MIRSIFSSLILGAALISAAPAFAVIPAGETKAVQLHFADLDLTNPAAARTLYRRIEADADYVCGGRPSSVMETDANAAYAACMRITIASAVHDVRAPLLTALVEGAPVTLAAR